MNVDIQEMLFWAALSNSKLINSLSAYSDIYSVIYVEEWLNYVNKVKIRIKQNKNVDIMKNLIVLYMLPNVYH